MPPGSRMFFVVRMPPAPFGSPCTPIGAGVAAARIAVAIGTSVSRTDWVVKLKVSATAPGLMPAPAAISRAGVVAAHTACSVAFVSVAQPALGVGVLSVGASAATMSA